MATEVYELKIDGVLNASYRQTVLHFQGVGTNANDTNAGGLSLTSGFVANLQNLFLLTLPASYSLTRLNARRAIPTPSNVVQVSNGVGNIVGTRGSNATSQQMCPSLFLVPAMGTKSGGKIFWPACPQGDMNQSIPSTAWQTAISNFMTPAIAGFTTSGITWTLVIYSKKHTSTAGITGFQFSPFVGFKNKRRKPVGAT